MNQLHRTLVAAALMTALGLAAVAEAQAQPAPPVAAAGPGARMMHGGHGPMADPARVQRFREERMARRLAELKQILQIAPQQEGAWNAWAAALKPAQFQRPDRVEFARMTTPERIDRIKALRAQRSAETDKRLDATKTFYAGLTAEQKRLFDAEGMHFLRARGMRGGRGGPMGHPMRG